MIWKDSERIPSLSGSRATMEASWGLTKLPLNMAKFEVAIVVDGCIEETWRAPQKVVQIQNAEGGGSETVHVHF